MAKSRRFRPNSAPVTNRILQAVSATTALLVVALASQLLVQGAARAATTPNSYVSRYIVAADTSSSLYSYGQTVGTNAKNQGDDPLVILDFGGQSTSGSTWGTLLVGTATFRSDAAIEAEVENFAAGFWTASSGSSGSSYLSVGIGTNNNGNNTAGGAGQTWGNVVDAVQSWVTSQGYYRVTVYGANDIEIGFCGDSVCMQDARDWANSYHAASPGTLYYNFGDCEGCRTDVVHPADEQTLGDGWTLTDVWYVSYGEAGALSTPEIYRTDGKQAAQWQQVAEHGHQASCPTCGTVLHFSGAMSQWDACKNQDCHQGVPGQDTSNTPAQSWNQLYQALNGTAGFSGDVAPAWLNQSLPNLLDVTWD